MAVEDSTSKTPPPKISLATAFWTWCRVAALSFGGPAGQISVMHRILVDEKKWIDESRFLHALNYCMLLPGPEAQQLATYIGWLMHRTAGGLMAGGLFILPGFVSILILSILFACYQETGLVHAILWGVKPAVVVIVVEAVHRIGKRVLKNSTMVLLAAASFVAIFFFGVPFPLLVLAAGLIGFIGGRLAPARFAVLKGPGTATSTAKVEETAAPHAVDVESTHHTQSSWGRSLLVSSVCLTLWFGPILLVRYFCGQQSVFYLEAVFFSQAAVVTFGGAYSVLAYIAQQAVAKYAWLLPGEMLDGLAMAESTPGPLIMVVQFVGFMGAYRNPGTLDPLLAGVLGSVLTTWVTFVPCFFWIFLGAPYVERLRGNRLLGAALSAITAAVVGVVLNLAVWFALLTLFAKVTTHHFGGGLRVLVPDVATLQVGPLAVAVLAAYLLLFAKRGIALTLSVAALVGIGAHFFK